MSEIIKISIVSIVSVYSQIFLLNLKFNRVFTDRHMQCSGLKIKGLRHWDSLVIQQTKIQW